MSGAPTFFEGPEKKVELAVVDGHPALRAYGQAFWCGVVEAAAASVLSCREGEYFDAYLLSESSLFVYDNFVTLITCGQTRLIDAVEAMLARIDPKDVSVLIYERKNEHFPHEQPTSFFEDAARLGRLVEGRALCFGAEHEHAIRLFHSLAPHQPEPEDRTLEVLMHGIDPKVAALFVGGASDGPLAARLELDSLLQGYSIDEHHFEPSGYSFNGMQQEAYATLHVTPQALGSYVSFETNADFGPDPTPIIATLLRRFSPESFDVLAFMPEPSPLLLDFPNYRLRKHVQEAVSGYEVTFQHFYRPAKGPERALSIPLPG